MVKSNHRHAKTRSPGAGMTLLSENEMKSQPTKPISVRIVHIFSPIMVQTDVTNFRSLVQRLTGKRSPRHKRDLASLIKADEEKQASKRKKTPAESSCRSLEEDHVHEGTTQIAQTDASESSIKQLGLKGHDEKDIESESQYLHSLLSGTGQVAGQVAEAFSCNNRMLIPECQYSCVTESVPEAHIVSDLSDIYDRFLASSANDSGLMVSSCMPAENRCSLFFG